MTFRACRLLLCLAFLQSVPALAWTTVGPGVEYQSFTLPDPNNVFVARMDRHDPAVTIESSIGQGRLSGGGETVGSQAARYGDALSFWNHDWGRRNQVIVAINGDFYDTSTRIPRSGQIHSGWFAKPYTVSAFGWTLDRNCFVTIMTGLSLSYRVLYLPSGNTQDVHGINRDRGPNELVLYTPQYDSNTRTDNAGVEVLVEMTRPTLAVPTSNPVRGRIRQILQNQGSTLIPFDHVVLSAEGTAAQTLLANANVGANINVFLPAGSVGLWDQAYASVGGGEVFLQDGAVVAWDTVRHPRTAIAFNDDYVFFVVVDGRSTVSRGMNMAELANFCKNYLDVPWAINLDGGGSSTMIVNGQLKNQPSDGNQRSVANGMMIVAPQPKLQSTQFGVNDRIRVTANTNVRLGPGTNYAVLATMTTNTQGTVLNHSLRGIYAKGFHWWKCDFGGGTVGWSAESLLALVSSGGYPAVTQHPVDQQVCTGQTAQFVIAASGAGGLGYRWQRNGVDLTDGGRYSGTTTPVLSIAEVIPAKVGSYRCVVTDQVGTAVSYSAALLPPHEPVVITQQPILTAPLPIPRGSSVEFSVAATGDGPVAYRWRKDGVDLSVTTPTLAIPAVRHSDGGTYVCRVSAGWCAVDSAPLVLQVTTPDFDGDGDVDQEDFGHLQRCLTGPHVPVTDPTCLDARLDPDDDVDADDVHIFLECVSGPNQPMRDNCPD